jgi:hypothetical protein
MEEHRFCYPTVIPLQLGATAHGPRDASPGLGAGQVRSAASGNLRVSADARRRPRPARAPWSHPQLRGALGGRG